MKMTKMFLVFSLAITTLTIAAQVAPMTAKIPGEMNRDAGYGCLPNSLYSQLPNLLGQGFADTGFGWSSIADDYTVAGPFTTMRFWGVYNGCTIETAQTFIIRFYHRNPDNPALPGVEFTSFNLTVMPQPIFIWYGYEYQMDMTLPVPVTLLDGWVSASRINPGDECIFGWLCGFPGNSVSYYGIWPDGAWQVSEAELAFCLGGGVVPQTPVSNWALIIGVILIGTFVIVRFRRLV